MIDRIDRVSKMMLREISEILNEEINDPWIKGIAITHVEVSRDLSIAKVYCTFPLSEKKAKLGILQRLKRAGSFFRGRLAERMDIKTMPRVVFCEDLEPIRKARIDDIFKKINEERLNAPGANGADEERRIDEQE